MSAFLFLWVFLGFWFRGLVVAVVAFFFSFFFYFLLAFFLFCLVLLSLPSFFLSFWPVSFSCLVSFRFDSSGFGGGTSPVLAPVNCQQM